MGGGFMTIGVSSNALNVESSQTPNHTKGENATAPTVAQEWTVNDMRLGDLDALYAEFEKAAWYNNADRDEVAETLLLDAPTIDAVEVVRCCDCKNGKRCRDGYVLCRHPSGRMLLMMGSDFCSYGKRKESNDGKTDN